MNGIASLGPGQAPQQGPQQPPQQGPQGGPQGTPQGMTAQLKDIPLPQLQMFLMNPNPQSPPLWAVISAIAEKQKEAKAMQMAQGQQVMAMNAQMQQQPPVAAQVMQSAQQMQEPVYAMYGGEMHGYSGGGAVAFEYGGATALPRRTGETDEEYAARMAVMPQQPGESDRAYQRRIYSSASRQKDLAAPEVPLTPQARERQQTEALTQASQAAPTYSSGIDAVLAAQKRATSSAPPAGPRTQAAAPAAQPSPATTATPAELTPEMAAAFKAQEDRLRGRLTRPESLTKAEEGLAALAKSNIEAQQAEAKTYGEEIRAARDAALARTQKNILSDPQALFALAGGMSTRRGEGIGSLARGAAGVLGQREAAAEAARKEFAMAQRDERSMQANIRQTQMLEAQRQVALEKGKLDEVNAINDQLSKLAIDRENFRLTRGDKAFEQALQGREVAAKERSARAAEISAGKPTDAQSRIALYRSDPKAYEAMYGSKESAAVANLVRAVNSDPALKSLAEGLKLGTPEAETRYNARYKELVATYAPELLLGAGGGGGGGALEAATAIARGGK